MLDVDSCELSGILLVLDVDSCEAIRHTVRC